MLMEGGWVSWGHPSFLSHNSSLNIIIKKLSNDKKRNHSLKYLSETDGSGDSEKILPLLQSSWKSTAVCHLEKDDTPQWWACLGKMEERAPRFPLQRLTCPTALPLSSRGVCAWMGGCFRNWFVTRCVSGWSYTIYKLPGKRKKKKSPGVCINTLYLQLFAFRHLFGNTIFISFWGKLHYGELIIFECSRLVTL